MTLKSLRGQLEDDLNLEKNALKPYKSAIAEFVDKIIALGQENQGENERDHTKDAPEKRHGKKRKSIDSDEGKDSDGAKKAGPRMYSARVNRLRTLCKSATITIPPNIYSKNKTDDELAEALEKLLDKNGLRPNASSHDIARVKARIQLERDLDGIDTSNIITEGRRTRRARVNQVVQHDYRSDDEEENSDNEVKDNNDSDVSEESDVESGSIEEDLSASESDAGVSSKGRKEKKLDEWSDDDLDD